MDLETNGRFGSSKTWKSLKKDFPAFKKNDQIIFLKQYWLHHIAELVISTISGCFPIVFLSWPSSQQSFSW